MGRPRGATASDEAKLRAIVHAIVHEDVGLTPVLRMVADPLRDLLRAKYAGGYGLRVVGEGIECAFIHTQLPGSIHREVNDSLATAKIENWALYNPVCPKPGERNRVKLFVPHEITGRGIEPLLRRHGLVNHHARVLICEGASMLAWVGGFIDEPPGPRERWLLQSLVVPLQRRLRIERQLAIGETAEATIDLAIDHIPGEVFILDRQGRVRHANGAGRARLAQQHAEMTRRLAAAIRHGDPELEVHVTRDGGTPRYLVIAKLGRDPAAHRTRIAARRWNLTGRQEDVLQHLARGHSNARISAELGISPRTVEVHVTAILDRAQVGSRSELIAVVFGME